jgi:mRNA interferase RelE/StbE
MRYKVELSKTAFKFLATVSKKDYLLITKKVASLADDPYQSGTKKLKAYDNTFRIKAGNYRILYTINGGKLIIDVVDIGLRKNIYE